MIDSFSMSTVFPKYHPRAGEPTGFEEAIFEHKKLHTIRSGNRWMAGDTARVFVWIGAPYRSKQRVIIPELLILRVYDIEIDAPYGAVFINTVNLITLK